MRTAEGQPVVGPSEVADQSWALASSRTSPEPEKSSAASSRSLSSSVNPAPPLKLQARRPESEVESELQTRSREDSACQAMGSSSANRAINGTFYRDWRGRIRDCLGVKQPYGSDCRTHRDRHACGGRSRVQTNKAPTSLRNQASLHLSACKYQPRRAAGPGAEKILLVLTRQGDRGGP